jgi:BlaI family transcriptional regulator, penicillinase repressor
MKTLEESDKKFEPTKSELEILSVLWQYGPSTVRFVNDQLNKERSVNYTTTLKFMQIMTDKGILKRDESQMKHIYHLAEDEEKTKEHLLGRFIDTIYNGSAGKLMIQILGNKKTSKEDIQKIRELINQQDNLNK